MRARLPAYILSLDDRTLCGPDEHTVVAIGPSFARWAERGTPEYQQQKFAEQQRLIAFLRKRFPGFSQAVRSAELASPRTIERYTMKNGGAVAGPKQMLGQHILHRLHIRTEWDNLYCCGESTVMGTGTPTVTTSGLSAANALCSKSWIGALCLSPGYADFVRTVCQALPGKKTSMPVT
jgi:prolycopene isomerase